MPIPVESKVMQRLRAAVPANASCACMNVGQQVSWGTLARTVAISGTIAIFGPHLGFGQTRALDVSQDPISADLPVKVADQGVSVRSGAPITITLQDALGRARLTYAQYRSALTSAKIAQEDRVQARASLLPTISYSQQYLGTQGNGVTPNGRFVTNDGVHVYRAWGVLHQEISASSFTLAPYRRTTAGAALAEAQAEIASRGLTVTVTSSYYGLISAQRRYASAQQALQQSQLFLKLTQELEAAREVAHSDVLKAQLQLDQQTIAFQEAQLSMEDAHLALGVLLSTDLNENFTVVDDTNDTPIVPPFAELKAMAVRKNPYMRSALETLQQTKLDVTTARAAFLPTLVVDVDYGIEANAFALRSTVAADPLKGPLPNLGYFVTAALNVPIWNWGATGSRLHQAEYRRKQAEVELSQTQRENVSNLFRYYNETTLAASELEILRHAVSLASETLRLSTLRYRSGEALVLEVSDAQTALFNSQRALADGQVRYRVSLATLQTLTGSF